MPETITIQNPQATMPLYYGVEVLNNTSDAEILGNVLTNARRISTWIKSLPAHDRTVLLCGSGPSIQHDLDTIRTMQANGAEVWALNNCANFLARNGMLADRQVIMDAQPRTVELIGPAKGYYFASQVHPSLFEQVPTAALWHATLGNILVDQQDGFPEHDEPYCLIGSAITVGNTALVLAYALGFRTLHCFGYDSSNAGTASHVEHQAINDGDVYTLVPFLGKTYTCSIVMKMQAEAFQSRAAVLTREGASITVHGTGLLPDMWNAPKEALSEQEKYQRIWHIPEYRACSPGEEAIPQFLATIGDERGTLIDIGCGTGRAGVKLHAAGFDVTLLDFTDNSRDDIALDLPFVQHDLTQPFPIQAEYGFCADVMEHIPTEHVPVVLRHILQAVKLCWFQISTVPDQFGALINQDLHLTVQLKAWWVQQINAAGGVVINAQELEGAVQLYVVSTH